MAGSAEPLRPLNADAMLATVLADGSAAHRHARLLVATRVATADLADAVHFLALLHGRYPGVLDHAADRVFDAAARDWMFRAAAGFAGERAYLTRLVVAAGPVPSTLGQAQSETAVTGQTHALAVLSQSERRGTALGAAIALVADWGAVRRVLDGAAARLGLTPPPHDLPDARASAAVVTKVSGSPGVERAMGFGAQQLLIQQRGLWDLLDARASARASG